MKSEERFTNRVDTYVKYRPGYPEEALDYLSDIVGLKPGSIVADIGAGTGIFSRLLLERGCRVTAVEPNQAMREAAESTLGDLSEFTAVPGTAEATGLPDHSIQFIVCAQSFHWFDQAAARSEFTRILRPGGKVALIWNSRLTHGTPFLEEYEQLLQTFGTDYNRINHKNISSGTLASFFKEGEMNEARFKNRQVFDFEGLKGRLLSSSYSPVPGDPAYQPMMIELLEIFERNERNGRIFFDYETEVFWGAL